MFLFGVPLGTPFNTSKKYFDPTAMIAASAGTTNAIIGAAGSIYGSNAAVGDSRSARDYDTAKTNQARIWSLQDQQTALQEAARSREYSTKEREAEQAFIAHQNSVQNQVAQMLAAGINPAAVFGQAGSGGQIGSAPTAPSLATAALSGAPIYGGNPASFGRSSAIKDMSEALASLTNAAGGAIANAVAPRKVESEINNIIAQTATEEQKAAYTKVLAYATNAKLPHELQNIIQDTALKVAQGQVAEAERDYKQAMAKYTDTKDEALKKQLPYIAADMEALIDLHREQKNTEKAKQVESYASADEAKQHSRLIGFQADIEEINKERELKVKLTKTESLLHQIEASDLKSNVAIKEALRRIMYLNNHQDVLNSSKLIRALDYELQLISDRIAGALNGVSPVLNNLE